MSQVDCLIHHCCNCGYNFTTIEQCHVNIVGIGLVSNVPGLWVHLDCQVF